MYSQKLKRKRYFSSNLMAKKKRDLCLQPDVKGFICTCNGMESQCIRESYNILNEYADKLFGEEKFQKSDTEPTKAGNDDEDDVLDEVRKEIDGFKADDNASKEGRRFQAIDTGVPNCIFIRTKLDDPTSLMRNVVEDLAVTKRKKSRYLIRMVPIDVTCKAYLDDVKEAAARIFDKYFQTESTTYAVVFNRRHNSNLERDAVIENLAAMVQERNSEHKVNLNEPSLTILVEVMKGICGLSVVRDYFKFCKYNLNNICDGLEKMEGGPSVKKETVSEVSETTKVKVENETDVPVNDAIKEELDGEMKKCEVSEKNNDNKETDSTTIDVSIVKSEEK